MSMQVQLRDAFKGLSRMVRWWNARPVRVKLGAAAVLLVCLNALGWLVERGTYLWYWRSGGILRHQILMVVFLVSILACADLFRVAKRLGTLARTGYFGLLAYAWILAPTLNALDYRIRLEEFWEGEVLHATLFLTLLMAGLWWLFTRELRLWAKLLWSIPLIVGLFVVWAYTSILLFGFGY